MKKFSVYKPNKKMAGAAFQFDFNPAKESVFVEAALQAGEQFNWNEKVIVKLSVGDLAKLLLVLEGKKKSIELFHDSTKTNKPEEPSAKPETGASLKNTSLSLVKGDYGFFIKAARQLGDGKVNVVNMPLSDDEGVCLEVLFRQAIARVYGW
ncbi:hypothetical protein HZC09_02270 [Candidatus Micrarchaeota archaeon]|nr:hypothetical protein [Candidatus Micrarchaeota archaeon]